jgi:hypothetical protein
MKKRAAAALAAFAMALAAAGPAWPAISGAATLPNDNHARQEYDNKDYCLSAHDVSLPLSEIKNCPNDELYAAIRGASDYKFYIRQSAFAPLTEGYAEDFSNVLRKPSEEGYAVRVAMPEITQGLESFIVYRVFVSEDAAEGSRSIFSGDTGVCYSDIAVTESTAGRWIDEGSVDASIAASTPFSAFDIRTGEEVTAKIEASMTGLRAEAGEYVMELCFTLPDGTRIEAPGLLTVTADPVYRLTIRYMDAESGAELKAPYETSMKGGSRYDAGALIDAQIGVYALSRTEGAAAGIITADTDITAFYSPVAVPPAYYCVTVRYIDGNTGKELAAPYRSSPTPEGSAYDVSDRTELAVPGYAISRKDGRTSGTLVSDETVTVYYLPVAPVVPAEAKPDGDSGGSGDAGSAGAAQETPGTDAPQIKAPAEPPAQTGGETRSRETQNERAGAAEPEQNGTEIISAAVPLQETEQESGRGKGAGVKGMEAVLLAAGLAALCALGGSISSDMRVLKWYEDKKRKAVM